MTDPERRTSCDDQVLGVHVFYLIAAASRKNSYRDPRIKISTTMSVIDFVSDS